MKTLAFISACLLCMLSIACKPGQFTTPNRVVALRLVATNHYLALSRNTGNAGPTVAGNNRLNGYICTLVYSYDMRNEDGTSTSVPTPTTVRLDYGGQSVILKIPANSSAGSLDTGIPLTLNEVPGSWKWLQVYTGDGTIIFKIS